MQGLQQIPPPAWPPSLPPTGGAHCAAQGLQVAGQGLQLAPVVIGLMLGLAEQLSVTGRGVRQVCKLARRGL